MRAWSVGDNVNLAVGQGDVQASPLQMAVAYSAIAMDGRVPRPHLGLQVEDAPGRLVQRIQPGAARKVDLDAAGRQAVLDGLHARPREPGGTSTQVWDGLGPGPLPGLRQDGHRRDLRPRRPYDQSWYVCWIKDARVPTIPDRHRRHRREGRLRRRGGGARPRG